MLRFRALRRLAPDWPATLRDNLRWYRDVFLALDEVTPRQVRTTRDAYAGGRDDLSRRRITLRNREFSRGEILAVVGQVDVGYARGTEDAAVAHRESLVGVAGRVLGTIGLRLHDDAGGATFGSVVREDAPEEIYRDLAGVPIINCGLQNILGDACSPVRSVMRRESSSRSKPASERIEDLRSGRTCPIWSCSSRRSSVDPLSTPTTSRRIVPSVRPPTSGSGRPST